MFSLSQLPPHTAPSHWRNQGMQGYLGILVSELLTISIEYPPCSTSLGQLPQYSLCGSPELSHQLILFDVECCWSLFPDDVLFILVSWRPFRGIATFVYSRCDVTVAPYVIGFEKRGNFAQNAKFWHFSSYHHFKAVRASDFLLGLWADQTFCFTYPTFEAVDSLLSEVVAIKPEV